MKKGIGTIKESELKELLGIPTECKITGVIHNQRNDEFEFILHSDEKIDGFTYDTKEGYYDFRMTHLHLVAKENKDKLVKKIIELDEKLIQERLGNIDNVLRAYDNAKNLSFNITIQGDKHDANKVAKEIIKGVKKLGGNI